MHKSFSFRVERCLWLIHTTQVTLQILSFIHMYHDSFLPRFDLVRFLHTFSRVPLVSYYNYFKIRIQNRGVARIFQRGGHHPGITDYIWFIPLLSFVYQRAQSYYRRMKAHIN